MKRSVMGCGVVVLMLMAGQALAQNEKPKGPAPASPAKPVQPATPPKPVDGKPGNAQPGNAAPAGLDPMTQAMMKAGQPGPEHEAFKKLVGTWDASVKMLEGAPEGAPESKGTMTNTLVLGGRYVHMDYKGTMMGMPFEGKGLWGFNNVTKKYESTWVDNMSTSITTMTGTYDAATKTYTSTGASDMPGPDGKPVHGTGREVVKIIDDNKHTMEMYSTGPDGKEMKVMEITYVRAGGAKPASAPTEIPKPKSGNK